MRKIAVALTKGGVGKTTTAVNVAAGLAHAGHTVLLIDVDTQGQAGKMLGCQPSSGLAEFVAGTATADQAIVPARDRLWLLGGGKSLSGVKMLIARKEFGAERTLAEALAPLDDRFEFAILDAAPGWDALTVNVLFYAREILSPVSLEVMTLQGLSDFAQNVASIQRYHTDLQLRYVLPTFFDRRVKKSEEIFAQLQTYYPAQVCPPVRYSVRLSEAPGYGQTIFEYAPHSSGAEDYAALTERIRDNGSQGNT
ncbi:MAG TPA: ParA family protein [Anaerolineae bacterium]|nr:ParA family protein [Anaerolineae bacterium]